MPITVKTFFLETESEIYSSGAITVRHRQPLKIQMTPDEGDPYIIRLIFSFMEGQNSSVKWAISENGEMTINITNFDSPYGLTTHEALNIGYYQGREILLDFIIYTLGNEPRTAPKLFCYTLRAGNLSDG
jgi:hypothetical protein